MQLWGVIIVAFGRGGEELGVEGLANDKRKISFWKVEAFSFLLRLKTFPTIILHTHAHSGNDPNRFIREMVLKRSGDIICTQC